MGANDKAAATWHPDPPPAPRCDSDGGQGIGAGHVCRCVLQPGHPLDDDRPHGCGCGALW